MVREIGGTEDPRLVPMGEHLYMTYTAYADIPRLAMARIRRDDFLRAAHGAESAAAWEPLWEKMGVVFREYEDKDGYLLPEPVAGRWVLFHRVPPDIQVVMLDELRFPLSGVGRTILRPRPGRWDAERIGGGAPALRTDAGWLHIYHGVGLVRGRRTYMLGAFLTAPDDPGRVLGRSGQPVLRPDETCELQGWVPHVVFTCGAVPLDKESTETLGADDEVLIYYGGADEVMCAARGRVGDLLGGLE